MDFFHKNFAGVLAIKRFNRVFLMTNFLLSFSLSSLGLTRDLLLNALLQEIADQVRNDNDGANDSGFPAQLFLSSLDSFSILSGFPSLSSRA